MQTLTELFEKFVRERLRGNGDAPVTIQNYRENFELLKKFKQDVGLEDLKKDFIMDFFEWLATRERKVGKEMIVRECKKSTIATRRGKLSTFFTWLVENGHLKENPFSQIRFIEPSYTDKRAFTNDQFNIIWKAISIEIEWLNRLIKKRNMAMVMFSVLTGVRKGELLGLRIKDLDRKNKVVTIKGETSKSKRDRDIPLNPELLPFLDDYLEARADYKTETLWVSGGTEDRPFTEHGLKHLVEKIKKETGIEDFHMHRFRHTFAVNYYTKSNNDLLGLKKLLGHRSFKMTISYLRSLSDDHVVEQIHKMTVKEFV